MMTSQKDQLEKVNNVQMEEHIEVVGKDLQRSPIKSEEDGDKILDVEPVLDYAGSAAKVNPEEIRLVRKLDCMMLASSNDPKLLASQPRLL